MLIPIVTRFPNNLLFLIVIRLISTTLIYLRLISVDNYIQVHYYVKQLSWSHSIMLWVRSWHCMVHNFDEEYCSSNLYLCTICRHLSIQWINKMFCPWNNSMIYFSFFEGCMGINFHSIQIFVNSMEYLIRKNC